MSYFIKQTQTEERFAWMAPLIALWGFCLRRVQGLNRVNVMIDEIASVARHQSCLFSALCPILELVYPRREMVVVVATQSRLIGKGSRKFSCFRCQT